MLSTWPSMCAARSEMATFAGIYEAWWRQRVYLSVRRRISQSAVDMPLAREEAAGAAAVGPGLFQRYCCCWERGSKMLLRIQVDPLREARGCSPVESWSE